MNYNIFMYYNLLFFLIITILLSVTIFYEHSLLNRIGLYLTFFILIKWILDYKKCTFGYIECKIRNVKKNSGIINNFCIFLGNLLYYKYNYIFFIIYLVIYFIHLIKFINITYKYI